MRKLLLFSSVTVLSLAVFTGMPCSTFAQNLQGPAPNTEITATTPPTGGGGITVYDPGMQNTIANAFQRLYGTIGQLSNEFRGDSQRSTYQGATIAGISEAGHAARLSAHSTLNALALQGKDRSEAYRGTSNVPYRACLGITAERSKGSAVSNYMKTRKRETAERSAVLAGADPISANGLIDYQRQMFDMAMQFCSQSELGGNAERCTMPPYDPADESTWDAFDHVTVATLLQRPNIGLGNPNSANDREQLKYLQNLLYGRVPASLNAELLKNPDTNIKNLYVEADRLRAELSIGQTAFTELLSLREPLEKGGRSLPILEETLTAGNFLTPEAVEILNPENRASLRAQLEVITLGQLNPNVLQQNLVDRAELANINTAYNTALNNYLQMYQINLLEIIALAVTTDIAASRYDAITELNAKIRTANGQ